jgi:hypothetical protein
VAFFAVHANRRLATGRATPVARLHAFFASDGAFTNGIGFWMSDDERGTSFDAWVDDQATSCWSIVDSARLATAAPILVGSHEIPPRIAHGFLGSAAMLLAARRANDVWDLHRVVNSFSPRTTLTNADVIAFAENSPQRKALIKRWLWWHDHNLNWTTPANWAAFASAAATREDAKLVGDSAIVLSHVDVSNEVRCAWGDLTAAHANLDFGPRFDVRYVGSYQSLPIYVDRDAARARLAAALDQIVAFVGAQDLDAWAAHFDDARRALDGPCDDELIQTHFADTGLTQDALQLLSSAWKADAFGGMGSWNDVGVADSAGYQAVSQALFESLRPAVEAAVNASA